MGRADTIQRVRPAPAAVLLGYLVIVAGLYLTAASWRGPDVDEFWSLGFSNPAIPLAEAFRQWSGDTGHPVGFDALMRLYFSAVPQSIRAARLFNLVPLLILSVLALRRTVRDGFGFEAAFVIVLLSTVLAIERFSQGRSYFLAIALVAILIVLVKDGFEGRPSAASRMGQAIALMLLALVNYTGFLAAMALLVAVAASHWAGARRGAAIATLACLAAGMAAFALSVVNGMFHQRVPFPYYVGHGGAVVRLGLVAGMALVANPVLAFLALRNFSAAARGGSGLSRFLAAEIGRFRGALALAALLAGAGFLAFNALFHVLVVRQLIGLLAIAAAAIAAYATAGPRLGRIVPAILIVGVAAAGVSAFLAGRERNFLQFVPYLEARQSACPSYRIYGLPTSVLFGPPQTDNARQGDAAVRRGLSYIEAFTHLRLEGSVRPAALDRRCGTAFWLPHGYPPASYTKRRIVERLGLDLTGQEMESARVRVGDGAVLVEFPARAERAGEPG